MDSHLLVHYGEIGTKGRNRPVFERYLRDNIRASLVECGPKDIEKVNQRFLVCVGAENILSATSKLAAIFGIAWYAPAGVTGLTYEEIRDEALRIGANFRWPSGTTFKISAKRPNKYFSMTSQELASRLGSEIETKLGLRVDLRDPMLDIHVDVLDDKVVMYTRKTKGLGGLPVGSSGRIIHLLSGGIDSPVAAWFMMKRGCKPVFLHFYLGREPPASPDSKIVRLVKRLSEYGGKVLTVLVPFSHYQVATTDISEQFEPIVFRYYMRRVAEVLAAKFDALAISSGDSLGQVASQTTHNIGCVDEGSSLPILRPLLGFDKVEIINLAKSIGTYEVSIQPYKDCCAMISRHPKTRVKRELVRACVEQLDFTKLIARSIEMGSLVVYDPNDGVPSLRPIRDSRGRDRMAPSQAGRENLSIQAL